MYPNVNTADFLISISGLLELLTRLLTISGHSLRGSSIAHISLIAYFNQFFKVHLLQLVLLDHFVISIIVDNNSLPATSLWVNITTSCTRLEDSFRLE